MQYLLSSVLNGTAGSVLEEVPLPQFARDPVRRTNRWVSFAASMVLHLAGLAVLPAVSARFLEKSEYDVWSRHQVVLRTLRLRVPEPLYLASAGPAQRPSLVYRPAAVSQPPVEAGAGRARAGRIGRRRRLDLPPLEHRVSSDQSILQPQYAADLLPSRDLHLPEVFFWAPQVSPVTQARPFLQPGHQKRPAEARPLDTPPGLGPPRLNIAALAHIPPQTAAPFAPSSPMPVRTSSAEEMPPHRGASTDPLPGDPTAVLSLSTSRMPLREFLTVPPGNQVGQLPGEPQASTAGAGGRSDRGTGLKGGGEGREQSAASHNLAAGSSAAPALDSENRVPAPAVPPAMAVRMAAAEATRLAHPDNGVFDVVIQSSELEGFPESAGVLSGRPVYSVFLNVGAPKHWILQYCIPAGDGQQAAQLNENVVQLGTPAPVSAPYPKITMRPLIPGRAGAYLMVHGTIDAAGRLGDLNILGAHDPAETDFILAVLEKWHFRPASQQGRAVKVEVLLAIPPER